MSKGRGTSFDSGSRTVSFDHQRNIFEAVVKAYVTIINSHPTIASNPDRDAPTQSRRLTFDAINYKIDIENATEVALKDRPKLQSTWFQLVAGDTDVDPKLVMRVIQACGTAYDARKLDPGIYLRHFRRGSPQRTAQ